MKLIIAAALSAYAFTAAASSNASIEAWVEANHACEAGEGHEGQKLTERETKEACITLGVLTTRLSDAGMCLTEDGFDWKPCE